MAFKKVGNDNRTRQFENSINKGCTGKGRETRAELE
jgi:hypothetical protein